MFKARYRKQGINITMKNEEVKGEYKNPLKDIKLKYMFVTPPTSPSGLLLRGILQFPYNIYTQTKIH